MLVHHVQQQHHGTCLMLTNLSKSKKISATVRHSLASQRPNVTKIQSKVSIISIVKILAPVRLATPRKLNAERNAINVRPLVVSKVAASV